MKNLIVIFCLVFLYSCTKNVDKEIVVSELSNAKVESLINATNQDGFPFPEGSRAFEVNDHLTRIVLPENVKFIFENPVDGSNMNFADDGEDGEAGVTCNCTSGSGCSPVKYRKKYYCVMDGGCSVCSKTASLTSTNTSVNIVGVFNKDLGVSFISDVIPNGLKGNLFSLKKEILSNASLHLFKIKDTEKELMNFYNVIYENKIPAFILNNKSIIPEGYKYVKVSIYGNEAAIPIPLDKIDSNMKVSDDGNNSVICVCNTTGSAGCTKGSFLGAIYCDSGNCASCSLKD